MTSYFDMKRALQLFFPVVLCVFVWTQTNAQESDPDFDPVDDQIIYNREKVGFIFAHNLGLGVGYKTGKNTTAFQTTAWAFELLTMRSPKQIKTINPYYNNSKRYVYGKLNDVFMLRSGYAIKKLLNRKPYWGGVEVRWLYEGGLSLAFEKPYYYFVVNVQQGSGGVLTESIETLKFDENAFSWDDIYGRAPFTRGINEVGIKPGIYVKSGFNFEFGYVKTSIKAFEAGAAFEYFPQGVSIMADDNNQPFFLTFYLAFSFGKRFNKY